MDKPKKRLCLCVECKKRITKDEETERMLKNGMKCDKCSGYGDNQPSVQNSEKTEESSVKYQTQKAIGRPK